MTDVPTGGRIVPVVEAHQHYSIRPADEAVAEQRPPTQQLPAHPPQPHQEDDSDGRSSQKLPPQSQVKSSKNTRSKNAETECLELPCLSKLGLYALPTEGDGNCLYYALSDQFYGDFTHADEIRVRLADHIAANKDYFMNFIAAVGGERRAPRRAAASAARYAYCSSSSASPAPPPTSKDKERSFDSKVAESRKKGVWGGAEEIQAFCQSYKRDVNVYTMYGIQNFRDVHASDDEERESVHIAFHDFHHYSSVRHTEGPHTGLPCIPTAEQTLQKEASTTGPTVVDMASPWKISAIQEGLGGKYDRDTIVGMLQQCRGNIDRAFENLLGEDTSAHPAETSASKAIMKSRLQQPSSRSSSPFSTGSKRSADESELEDNPQPAMRRNRARDQKRRILPDVTVGIAFRDDQNDLVSLRLRVSPDAVAGQAVTTETPSQTESDSFESGSGSDGTGVSEKDKKSRTKQKPASSEPATQKSEAKEEPKPRRSQRLTKARNASKPV
ncbi:hypothetical protein BDV32DRAFT_127595 [Aspergillus pseudonomiae]|uniref:Uncharacterized protein n=1 Tax=Aspergillus pseudonomiae TaxID=1506151 RepID=A0A5N6HS23_9EURO|nr:uncharacterized protein BDV37DRAFT_254661 [Aspergillus pseudonomiae]KAB8257301.1 hypothetical protein BDV32DRAFT_127595 [Aspergillus pseudonomiae]KAE8401588.1 hypothetical protein BDV37DRAFT_254661 [Aspergillus pseudonomiae]